MTITSFDNLQKWFYGQQRTEDEVSAHWNLYGTRFGETEKRVSFNQTINDKDASFAHLAETIRFLNNPDGAVFRIQVFPKGKPNNPTGNVYVQIFEKSAAPHSVMAPTSASGAAISGLPPGVGSIQEYVNKEVEMALMKKELQDLREMLAQPNTGWERAVETISGIPGIDKALHALVAGLVTKINPAAAPAVQAAMAGTPDAQTGGNHDEDNDDDPQAVFADNINMAATRLQTDPVTLAKKINQLVHSNPEVAKQLLNAHA